ncbi:unnamed protein product, partial [marine sediment metagenome]
MTEKQEHATPGYPKWIKAEKQDEAEEIRQKIMAEEDEDREGKKPEGCGKIIGKIWVGEWETSIICGESIAGVNARKINLCSKCSEDKGCGNVFYDKELGADYVCGVHRLCPECSKQEGTQNLKLIDKVEAHYERAKLKPKSAEKSLSEKRKELYYEMKEPLTTEEEEMLLIAVFDFIAQQDKEAIRKLKEVVPHTYGRFHK